MPSQYTKEAMILFNALVQAKIPVSNCDSLYIEREEKNREGIPKAFIPDLLIGKSLIVEIEGKGSSSKNNHERDEFLKSKGYIVLHISNALVKHDLFTAVKLVQLTNYLVVGIEALRGVFPPDYLPVEGDLYDYIRHKLNELEPVLEMLTKENE